MIINNSPFFYYDENGQKYFDKISAVKSNNPFKFYYYDHMLMKINWNEEPKKTLKELYKERAQQIRDKFDYVILFYSGGHDSTNVLESFYYNNIHIDEIVSFGSFRFDPHEGSDANHNAEIHKSAIPILKSLNLPNTKIKIVDYSKDITETFFNEKWLYSGTSCYGVMSLWLANYLENICKTNKKTAFVYGIDRPAFKLFKNKISYTFYSDNGINDYGPNFSNWNTLNSNSNEVVFFYWDVENAEITRKQLHTIKNFFCERFVDNPKFKHVMDLFNDNEELTYHIQQTIGLKYWYIIYKLLYQLNNPILYMSDGKEWGGVTSSYRGIGKSNNVGDKLNKIISGHDAFLLRPTFPDKQFQRRYIEMIFSLHPWPWPDTLSQQVASQPYYF